MDGLLTAGTFPPASILYPGAIDAGLEEALNAIHRQVSIESGSQPELSASARRVLALCARVAKSGVRPSRIQRAVNEAE